MAAQELDLIHSDPGFIGFGGNWIAAIIRTRAGRSLDSPALIADGNHARADSYVSLAVVASAAVVALGLPIADPLIGLDITAVIIKITWDSWWTARGGHHHTHWRVQLADKCLYAARPGAPC